MSLINMTDQSVIFINEGLLLTDMEKGVAYSLQRTQEVICDFSVEYIISLFWEPASNECRCWNVQHYIVPLISILKVPITGCDMGMSSLSNNRKLMNDHEGLQ